MNKIPFVVCFRVCVFDVTCVVAYRQCRCFRWQPKVVWSHTQPHWREQALSCDLNRWITRLFAYDNVLPSHFLIHQPWPTVCHKCESTDENLIELNANLNNIHSFEQTLLWHCKRLFEIIFPFYFTQTLELNCFKFFFCLPYGRISPILDLLRRIERV